ncbi:hypothetical protein [Nocardia carnea]|uniref:hypothetical protein n=1 Tax=Nocardia carnea TaxID=37328 RepID=UPI00245892A4|nr:hypothetical protein [Nocardia carnea]
MVEIAPEAAEDTWVVPEHWWADAAPFRGSGRPGDLERAAGIGTSLAQFMDGCTQTVDSLLAADAGYGPTALSGAVAELAYPDRTPRAGALICVLASTRDGFDAAAAGAVADAWVAEHGLVFAAEAAIRLTKLQSDLYGLRPRRVAVWGGVRASITVVHYRGDPGQLWTGGVLHKVLPQDHPLEVWSAAVERVRERLAEASESDYRLAVARLARLRADHMLSDVAYASVFLVPTEQRWLNKELASGQPVEELSSLAETGKYALLAASATTGEQLARIVELAGFAPMAQRYPDVIVNCGPKAAPVLARYLDEKLQVPRRTEVPATPTMISTEQLCSTLARFPTDEAFELLLARAVTDEGKPQQCVVDALQQAARRFPRRAMRILVQRGTTSALPELQRLLHEHARRNPGLLITQRRNSPHDLHELGFGEQHPESIPAGLSGLLENPPWEDLGRRPRTRRVVRTPPGRPLEVKWLPGERERWARTPTGSVRELEPGWAQGVLAENKWGSWGYDMVTAIALGPEAEARERLRELERETKWSYPYWFGPYRRMIGRFERDALDITLEAAQRHPAAMAPALATMDGTAVTRLMLHLLLDSEAPRHAAAAWFDRHIDTAAVDLVAWALGAHGTMRNRAESALHQLVRKGHLGAIRAAAEQYGDAALREADAMLHPSRRIWQLPGYIPPVPQWVQPTLLPQILLRDGHAALPRPTTARICTMLAMWQSHEPYDGVRALIEAADPRSLAAFARALFRAWYANFARPGRESSQPVSRWVLRTQGLLGDDTTVHLLGHTIPRLDDYCRNRAIDALAELRSVAAWHQLDSLAHADLSGTASRRARRSARLLAADLNIQPAVERPG